MSAQTPQSGDTSSGRSEAQDVSDGPEALKFSPEEEAALLKESLDIKTEANNLFLAGDYHNALSRYEDALSTCPKYLDYDRAVVQSNVAACYLKLEKWKDAAKAATGCLEGLAKLEREDPKLNPEGGSSKANEGGAPLGVPEDKDVDEEIVSLGASNAAPASLPEVYAAQAKLESRRADIMRIRTKALLRRARARAEEGGWQNLAGAEEDYRALSKLPTGALTASDARTVRSQLRDLPPRTKAAQEKEMGEMWGKLKQLGDGILKPFGLSTNNFQMVKDEKTGGYSMNFSQGQGGPSS